MHYTIAISGLAEAKLTSPDTTLIQPGMMRRIPVTVTADGFDISNKVSKVKFIIFAEEDPSISITKDSYFYKN